MNKRTKTNTGRYDFKSVEQRWRPYWNEIELYKTGDDPGKPKYYILDYFPYPSGDGLSVGHCRNYVPTCVDARFHRMTGYNVLHPMGWDAFGLPAENYAIKHHIHPRDSTKEFCDTYRRQMQLVECSYDWSREINSTYPDYYRWTQWFFLLLYHRGLAYQAMGSQWWCPQCQTILANEQVENGRCWRCDTLVVKKDLRQWYFRITDYAERLLTDLETIDWPEPIKVMQRNWIGRSAGAEVIFQVEAAGGSPHDIPVFTTRPDTLFGVSFLVLAPEHPLVAEVTTPSQQSVVAASVERSMHMTEIDRLAADKEKTGVFTGTYAVHPLHGGPVPIWVADYVLMGYGTGAIMGVPGHDQRDFDFAQKYDLPIIEVISPDGQEQGPEACFTDYGLMIHSGEYSGLSSAAGGERIVADLEKKGRGRKQVTYRMRDWLISRQRYWGAPIPIIHCPVCGPVPVPEDQLPVLLPDTNDFAPTGDGRSPLARVESWVSTQCPQCSGPAERETDTMDGFACSSWYFLRFTSPHEENRPFDPEAMRYWMPVDTYVGGAEHAVMHLLYSRYWTKVLYDAGMVPFAEPFSQLRNQGMLLSPVDGRKMSKSKGNVVTPDEVVAEHGTDALRAYVLFLGPFDAEVTWDDTGIRGITRFLDRYWKLANTLPQAEYWQAGQPALNAEFERRRHQSIQRITDDMRRFRFNTAVAALMEYLNYLTAVELESIEPRLWRQAIESFTLLLAPIAPFIAEEVWQSVLGYRQSVHLQSWPTFDEQTAAEEEVTVVVQVNGRLRDKVQVPADADDQLLRDAALNSPNVQRHTNDRSIRKIIVIPRKLVNIVV
jgi:leucyl-tRNA synthetase